MTDITPTPEPTRPLEGTDTAASRGGGGRTALVTVLVVVLVAIVGGGAWAAFRFFYGGGPRPAEVLPSSTVAVISIDLDPSAGQKIAAIRTIRKFPALKKSLGLKADDDLRKFIVEKVVDSGSCGGLSFDDDVKPWIGKRAAIGAVDLGGKYPAPVLALQVTDKDKARAGFRALARCGGAGNDVGFVVTDDYLIASDSTEHAREIQRAGAKKPLADDAGYQRWTGEAGDQGVLNFYVAKEATKYLSDLLDSFTGDLLGGSGASAPRAASVDPFAGFQGLAGTVRFADGGMELSFASGGLKSLDGTATVGKQIGSLPDDTVFAFGIGVPGDFARTITDGIRSGGAGGAGDLLSEAEDASGLKLPDDLQALLGSALTLSIGSDLMPKDLSRVQHLGDIPAGLVIHGDATRIKQLITSIEEHTGYRLRNVPISVLGDHDRVVLSPSQGYAERLLRGGSLKSSENFREAVPTAGRATSVFYLNFDSPFRRTLLQFAQGKGASADDVDLADRNTKPLTSLGLSSWVDGKVAHVLLKVTTG